MVEARSVQTPKWLTAVYLTLFSSIGVGLAVYCIYHYFKLTSINYHEILELVVLLVALSLCRSLPLPTRSGQGMDISSIILYAAVISKGIYATTLIFVISVFFTFARWDNKKVSHVFNTPIDRTLFNNANYIISMLAGYFVYWLAGGGVGHLNNAFPNIIWQSLLFLIVMLVVDSINLFTILKLEHNIPYLPSLLSGIRSMLPTLLAFAPIGFFLAYIFGMNDNGPYIALLFLIPLLFARYAFKLYLDSKEQYLRTISTLTTAIEAKDEYTEGHSKRVAEYSVQIAQAMGLRSARIENIKVAAMLHDIGKIGIEDSILRKPSKLDPDEWQKIMEHPSIGIKILEEVAMPDAVKDMILYHHIRYDLKGYPKPDGELNLPMEVHIISLADAFDAMTSDRPYRKAMPDEVAFGIILQEKGTQFHPDVVDAFMKMKKGKQPGN